MSIWSTILAFDDDDHADDCNVWVPQGKTGPHSWTFTMDPARPCMCGLPTAPILYQRSHILPSPDDPRGGSVQLAQISGHITRDGRDDQPEDSAPWPWLRLSVGTEDVVLGERHAEQLRDALTHWLDTRRQAG